MKNNNSVDVLSVLEQFETEMANIAKLTASYYEELIKNKVPVDLAYNLTENFHNIWWSHLTGKKNS